MLREKFVAKREETTGLCRRLYKEELYALYSSPYIFRVMKLRRID
jgi:hypothetical protein